MLSLFSLACGGPGQPGAQALAVYTVGLLVILFCACVRIATWVDLDWRISPFNVVSLTPTEAIHSSQDEMR